MPDARESQRRSVDNLQQLYAFVVSLAVTESIRGLVTSIVSLNQLPAYNQTLMFAALIITVIPLYHGANRYLDATYVTGERITIHAALMLDFVMLFVEAILFFVAAMLSQNEQDFYTALAILFSWDVVWILSTKLTERSTQRTASKAPKIYVWAIMNIVAAGLILILVRSTLVPGVLSSNESLKNTLLLAIVALRTVMDYGLMWGFYYPRIE